MDDSRAGPRAGSGGGKASTGGGGDLAYWMGRVDSQLEELRKVVDQWNNGNDSHRVELRNWQRAVDERLARLEVWDVGLKALDGRLEKLEQGRQQGDGDEDKDPSWRWAIEKVVLPILLGFVAWFLLTVLPELVKLIP